MGGYGSGGYGFGGYGGVPVSPGPVPSIDYYQNLFTSLYKNSPNLLAFTLALLTPISDIGALLNQWIYYFDIDEAAGVQLDRLGVILGVSRTVTFQPSNGVSPILNDQTFRILLKAKVGLNQWNGKIPSLYPLWQTLFPGGQIYVQDNQNMTATITLAGAFTSIIIDLVEHDMIVPRPEGVQYTFAFPKFPMFGLDANNPSGYIAGLDAGYLV